MNLIRRYLSSEDIVVELDAPDGQRVLGEAALMLERRHGLHREVVLRALSRREEIGSTALGHGVAIPHARMPGVSEPRLLFIRTRYPVEFGAPDRKPVSLFFVILVPEHANEEHLQILGSVARMFSDRRFRRSVETASSAGDAQRLFCSMDAD